MTSTWRKGESPTQQPCLPSFQYAMRDRETPSRNDRKQISIWLKSAMRINCFTLCNFLFSLSLIPLNPCMESRDGHGRDWQAVTFGQSEIPTSCNASIDFALRISTFSSCFPYRFRNSCHSVSQKDRSPSTTQLQVNFFTENCT